MKPSIRVNPEQATAFALAAVLSLYGKNDDEMTARIMTFLSSLLEVSGDEILLWIHGLPHDTEYAKHFAETVRSHPNIEKTVKILTDELDPSKNGKPSAMLKNFIQLINGKNEFKRALHDLIPPVKQEEPTEVTVIENNIGKLLDYAEREPELKMLRLEEGKAEAVWRIARNDGVVIHIPISHPQVSHLNDYNAEGIKLTVEKIKPSSPAAPRVRSDSNASEGSGTSGKRPHTPPTLTSSLRPTRLRTSTSPEDANDLDPVQFQIKMQKSRDDKLRDIEPLIAARKELLKQRLPLITDIDAHYRSLGWARSHLETFNRVVPGTETVDSKAYKRQVLEGTWSALIGAQYHNLKADERAAVQTWYQLYKDRKEGCHPKVEKDALIAS